MHASADRVEVRYPKVMQSIVAFSLVSSAVLVPTFVFFVLPAPLNIIMAAVMAVMELGVLALMWLLMKNAYVRADRSGVTYSFLGQTKLVRWDEMQNIETEKIGDNARVGYVLKNPRGETLLSFNDFGNRADGDRLLLFIQQKLQGH